MTVYATCVLRRSQRKRELEKMKGRRDEEAKGNKGKVAAVRTMRRI